MQTLRFFADTIKLCLPRQPSEPISAMSFLIHNLLTPLTISMQINISLFT